MEITRPALRYHGGKFRLAPWIMQFFPPHQCYVEPFGGAAGVLIQKPRCYAEVYNDLDGEIVNFFRVLRDPATRDQLIDACRMTPYARAEFELSYCPDGDPVEQARRTAVRASMGFGSAGATKQHTGFRVDTRRSYGTAQHNWARYPDSIALIGHRFEGVLVENAPACEVMGYHDEPTTLHFVDPPYMPETRVLRTGQQYYRHEMTIEQHRDLLSAVKSLRGMVVLCGYPSELYDEALSGWERHATQARIAGGRGTSLRTEVVWLNPACSRALDMARGGLFAGIENHGLCDHG